MLVKWLRTVWIPASEGHLLVPYRRPVTRCVHIRRPRVEVTHFSRFKVWVVIARMPKAGGVSLPIRRLRREARVHIRWWWRCCCWRRKSSPARVAWPSETIVEHRRPGSPGLSKSIAVMKGPAWLHVAEFKVGPSPASGPASAPGIVLLSLCSRKMSSGHFWSSVGSL